MRVPFLLRRSRQRLEAVRYGGPAQEAPRWRPAAGFGLFELRTTSDRLPSGWVQLTLEIAGPLPAAPRLLVDDGQGFAEAAALQLPLPHAGRVHAIVELPARVRQLVLEIGNASQISLGALVARELGAAETALRLALPVVRRRFTEPWSIPISTVRLARALWTGAFLQRMAQKQSYDEPQLWYERWHRCFAELSDADRAAIRSATTTLQSRFSVLLVAGENDAELQRAVESVRRQLDPAWELCIAGPRPVEDPADARIRFAPWDGTGGPAGAANAALRIASGDFILLLGARDELTEHALYLLADAAGSHPGADVIYADEDSIDAQGRVHDPVFKPDWNPDLFLSTNYLGRSCAIRRTRALEVGGYRSTFEGSHDYDLLLRVLAGKAGVPHVPFMICHRRTGEGRAGDASARAVQDFLGAAAVVEPGPFPSTQHIRWQVPAPEPLVSLLIPTRDGRRLLEPCVESLLARTAYRAFEILIVDNGSREPDALDYLAALERRGVARVLRYDAPFNFSALNNFAVREARGDLVGLLNNDLEFVDPGWLGEMVSHAARQEVGAVGARLLYPDRTVQHAGVLLGIGGVADHLHKNLPADAPGYCGRAQLTQNFSAVTAACLVVRRETYQAVGGLDERYAVAFNDVDFCLRLRERGLRNVWTPFATVIHHESKSRGRENTLRKMLRFRGEMARLKSRWGKALLEDPAYNPNLTLDARNLALAWPPRVRPPWRHVDRSALAES